MKLLIVSLCLIFIQIVPFHSLNITDSDNNTINFSGFEGKKVLIVNVATNSPDSAQFRGLEELHQLYGNQLVILAVPSNDFGNEPLPDADIKNSLQNKYGIHYVITQSMGVKDSASISPLYEWITKKAMNGMTDSKVAGDFCKYLVNGNGQLVGIYSNKILPTDPVLKNAFQ